MDPDKRSSSLGLPALPLAFGTGRQGRAQQPRPEALRAVRVIGWELDQRKHCGHVWRQYRRQRLDWNAVVKTAYDTTEPPTEAGDKLEVLREDQDSGWSWCRANNGCEGWVPDRTLTSIE